MEPVVIGRLRSAATSSLTPPARDHPAGTLSGGGCVGYAPGSGRRSWGILAGRIGAGALQQVGRRSTAGVLIPQPLAAATSRLGRRRPLPRTTLGFGDLFGGHALCNVISVLHGSVAVFAGELRGGEV